MKRYSAWSVFWNGLTGQKNWDRAWRDPEPKSTGYDVVIVGGGLHGLSTAYHLATRHHEHAYARGPGYLDWDSQPDPFRRYAGARLYSCRRPESGGAATDAVWGRT